MNHSIYKINCRNTGRCYIGNTGSPLEQRLQEHEIATKYKKNPTMSREIIEGGNYEILLLENCLECDKKEREKFHILQNKKICVNKCTPWTSTDAKWVRKDKNEKTGIIAEDYDEYMQQYRAAHRDRMRAYNKDYYEKNREKLTEKHDCELCGGKYTILNKFAHCKSTPHKKVLKMLELKKEAAGL